MFFGFVKTAPAANSTYKGQTLSILPWNAQDPNGTGAIEGVLRYNHFSRPPMTQGFWPGEIITEGWVALNDSASGAGLYFAQCDPNGHFLIHQRPGGHLPARNLGHPAG